MDSLSRHIFGESLLSLEVPAEKKIRDEIREKVENYFSGKLTVPPVSYHDLAEYADDLIALHKWDAVHKAFVMVCSGNAVWRPVVGSIPFYRRMLLLPQCLKNSNMCKGIQDELGLICSECGNCNISGFLREAENLGYLTVVTEGTTVASRLVESGKVDAIIGVGCMEVLQKLFRSVRKYSVPAIGVPLLTCGCRDTTADYEWVREEIKSLNVNTDFSLLNINNLSKKTEALFTEERVQQLLKLSQSSTDKIIKEILLAGGKRIRPLLTVLAYESLSKNPDQDILNQLAISVECFHKASLVHDDIEDDDTFRYGRETIHARYGIPVAINTGDLLLGEGYRLISECNLQPEVKAECFKVIANAHKTMSVGQGTELIARKENMILSVDDIIEVFKNKTSSAFNVSLQVGAIAAGADEYVRKLLNQFSNLAGIAYQMRDDLEDLNLEDSFSKVKNPSLPISLLACVACLDDIILLKDAILHQKQDTIVNLCDKYGIRDKVNDMIKEYLRKIYLCLDNFKNVRLKLALNEIVGKTFGEFI